MAKWVSPRPTQCDVCGNDLKEEFIDGATRSGPWAVMCKGCHGEVGCGLGTGQGQLYDLDTLECLKGGREARNDS